MAIFLVTYEPQKGEMSLADFGLMLNRLGAPMKVLGTTWLVRTTGNSDWLCGEIKDEVGAGVYLLVGELDQLSYARLYPEDLPLLNFLNTR